MKRAFIFPGQGAQIIGMGQEFYESEPQAREVFQTVDEVLGYSLSDIIFNGTSEELALTTNTQPALMATSIAMIRVLMQKSGKTINELCSVVAGHSLGEYSALCASNVLTLEDTAKLLKVRSSSMQTASPAGEGAMAACLGVSAEFLQQILDDLIEEGVCQIANDNVEGQVVISGHEYNVERIVAALKDTGYKAVKLNVTGPYHSALIKAAEAPMQEALNDAMFSEPSVPMIANVSADVTTDIQQMKANLLKQICSTVRWRETMNKLAQMGVFELVEIGSGRVLSGLAKKSPHDFVVRNISSIQDMDLFLESL